MKIYKKMKNLRFNLGILGLLIIMLSACEKENLETENQTAIQEDIHDTSGIVEEQELRIDDLINLKQNEQLPSLVDIDLENGNQLHFYAQEEEIEGVLILEEGDCSGCSALSDLESVAGGELNPKEIFLALSKSGTPVPKIFDKLYTSDNAARTKQGWMRSKLTSVNKNNGNKATVACNNTSFQSSIAGGFLGNPNYVRLDKKPNNYSGFVSDCFNPAANGQCWGNPRYKLTAQFSNIKNWKGKVCTRNVENNSNPHTVYYCGSNCNVDPNCNLPGSCSIYQGPQISFEYYWNGQWRIMKSGNKLALYEIQANQTKVYNWHWITSQNTSFRIRVRYAKPNDEFDLMMDK